MNKKVLIFSIIGIVCVALAIVVDWLFLMGAVIFMMLNQRELFGKRSSSQNIAKHI